MEHKQQNQQIETLSALALSGGAYSWTSTPISENEETDPNFYLSQPDEALRREALAAARRENSALLGNELNEQGERMKHGAPGFREQRILQLFDRLDRKRRRSRDIERGGEEWKKERDRQESRRVAGDSRRVAFDVSPAMPLNSESLYTWHAWLYKHVSQFTPGQRLNLDRLKDFMRTRGRKRFSDLSWHEKDDLRGILTRIAECEIANEA